MLYACKDRKEFTQNFKLNFVTSFFVNRSTLNRHSHNIIQYEMKKRLQVKGKFYENNISDSYVVLI